MTWNQAEALTMCRVIESVAPQFGCHVALTGGTLYKDGQRKDLDLVFYRIRQTPAIDVEGLFNTLGVLGMQVDLGIRPLYPLRWVYKAKHMGRVVDLFFPESCDEDHHSG